MAQAEESNERNKGGLPPGTGFVVKNAIRFGAGLAPAYIIAAVVIFAVVFIVILNPSSGGGLASNTDPDSNGGVLVPPGVPNSSLVSCPVAGGKVSYGSYQADPINGHCGATYGYSCKPNDRRAKSIDVPSRGKDVVLPQIQSASVNWKFIYNYKVSSSDCKDGNPKDPAGECGRGYVFRSDNNYTLHLLHLSLTRLVQGQTYPSGTIVGRTATTHVHVTIGKDIQDPIGMAPFDPGWMAADRDAGICVPVSTTGGSNTCTSQYEGTGPCTAANLMPYFGNDPKKALIASLICQAESCSNQHSFNNACTTGGSLDYSIGFFQINALAHCAKAFSYTSNPIACWIINESERQACESRLFSAAGNIESAVSVSNQGTSWTPWSTWTIPNSCSIGVINVLNKCGIKY